MLKTIYFSVHSWDNLLCLKIFNLNGRKLVDGMMYGLSRFGDGYFYAIIGILMLFINFDLAIRTIPTGLLAFAIELSVHKLIKHKTKRSRPFEIVPEIRNLLPVPDKFSFPSGHTGAAFVMATIFGTIVPGLLFPSLVIALLIGFSRIYNGLHYPSDVLAGMILGISCAKISLAIFSEGALS